MKLASFDIELSTAIPDGDFNRDILKNTGVSCAAIALSDKDNIIVYEGDPELTVLQSQNLVKKLDTLQEEGYGIVTWNGCSFDFQVLAHNAKTFNKCAQLALSHHDLMLYITFQKGWYLALEKALHGANLKGKLKKVNLSDDTILDNMNGARAPELWSKGEKEAVIEYLKQDVKQQLELAIWISSHNKICWTSNSGKPWSLPIKKLYTVQECFNFPLPDVSWMDNPPERSQFVDWMPSGLRPQT